MVILLRYTCTYVGRVNLNYYLCLLDMIKRKKRKMIYRQIYFSICASLFFVILYFYHFIYKVHSINEGNLLPQELAIRNTVYSCNFFQRNEYWWSFYVPEYQSLLGVVLRTFVFFIVEGVYFHIWTFFTQTCSGETHV